jgi:hypothetical protein
MAARKRQPEPVAAPVASTARVPRIPDTLAAWNAAWSRPRAFSPLTVTATLRGAVAVPNGPIAFDGLLGAAVAMREGLVASTQAELLPIALPLAQERGVYLASDGVANIELHEHRFINRRFPLAEAQTMGDAKLRRIQLTSGRCKSFRLPLDTVHLDGDRMTWWALGDRSAIEALLAEIRYLGKRRAVGLGAVARWDVAPCEPWQGFPVVRDGEPLRSLPIDWPGLAPDVERAMRCLVPPYWRRDAEELCAVPRWTP